MKKVTSLMSRSVFFSKLDGLLVSDYEWGCDLAVYFLSLTPP